MAAGVGKTYRMLQEGQAEADAGRDVVIGYLEPHDRAGDQRPGARAGGGAAARVADPRRRRVEEMDLPALLARGPELALIDELAHTNAPGPRARASATRTSPTCSPPGSTSSRPSTSSTSSRSTTRSPS